MDAKLVVTLAALLFVMASPDTLPANNSVSPASVTPLKPVPAPLMNTARLPTRVPASKRSAAG